jgi:hypothetical protein
VAKNPANIRSLARMQTMLAVRTLTGICGSEAAPASARVMAANSLLDRGWGRAVQPHVGEGGDGHIQVVIRTILDVTGEIRDEPLVIEHDRDKA